MAILNKLSIRFKFLLTVVVGVLFLVLAIYVISSQVLQKSFLGIERDAIENDLRRVDDALQNSSDTQLVKLKDWATWDDSYNYAINPTEEFRETNLKDTSLINLDLDLVMYFNANHELIFSKVLNHSTGEEIESSGIVAALTQEDELITHNTLESFASGFLSLPEGVLMVSSRPLLQSTGEGPISGTLLFAQFLDEQRVADIAELTHLEISTYLYDSDSLPEDVIQAKEIFKLGGEYFVHPNSSDEVSGYSLFRNLNGDPLLIIEITQPRPVYSQGVSSVLTFMIIGGFAIVMFGIVIITLIEQLVISRFVTLRRGVEEINKDHDITQRLPGESDDDIGALIRKINQMLTWLNESRVLETQLRKREVERTNELDAKVEELKKMNLFMVDRELKMVELKKEIETLQNKVP